MSSVTPTRYSLNNFLRSIRVSGLTLDLGCGSGQYKQLFPNRIGLDVKGGLGVDIRGNACSLPFQEASFDIVLCTEVLEHVFEPARAIQEIQRVLRPGGICILTTRFCYPIHDSPNDFYRFTEFALRRLFTNWEMLYLQPDTDVISSIIVMFWYASADIAQNRFLRCLLKICWTPVWKIYFRLYPWFSSMRISLLAPTGYHLIARKSFPLNVSDHPRRETTNQSYSSCSEPTSGRIPLFQKLNACHVQ